MFPSMCSTFQSFLFIHCDYKAFFANGAAVDFVILQFKHCFGFIFTFVILLLIFIRVGGGGDSEHIQINGSEQVGRQRKTITGGEDLHLNS